MNARVLRFDNAALKANGASADGVLGQPNFTSNTQGTTQSTFATARGLTFDDGADRLFVVDMENNRVMVFNNASTKANGANADNVIGQGNFTSGGPGTSITTLRNPFSAFYDPGQDLLWVGDTSNHRVLMYGQPRFKTRWILMARMIMCALPILTPLLPTRSRWKPGFILTAAVTVSGWGSLLQMLTIWPRTCGCGMQEV